MSLAEIQSELAKLTSDELRSLALLSWAAFKEKECLSPDRHQCSEANPTLLNSLDAALAQADANPGEGTSANELRARLREWIAE